MLTKRDFLAGAVASAALTMLASSVRAERQLSVQKVLFDPEIPALGNPDGAITIAEYFDYQCPFCKRGHKDLLDVVREDGDVRLVMKDWPIFGGASFYASSLVLAAGTNYERALNAVMSTRARLTNADVDAALESVGLDPTVMQADLEKDVARVDAIMERNMSQANILGFNGTPAFIIGKRVYAGALDVEAFKQAIALAKSDLSAE